MPRFALSSRIAERVRVGPYRRLANRLFHLEYYRSAVWQDTYWLGTPVLKCPLDLWVYQELLTELQPDLIVETGTRFGGSALFLGSICESIGKGRVVSIDIEDLPGRPQHDRVEYLLGSSTASDIVARVAAESATAERVLVILDSLHSRAHVLAEMNAYAPFVSPGSYLIVEDTNVNGHPVLPGFGPGPMEAVDDFLRDQPGFVIDSSREKFMMTFSPRGYLRRVA